jgi:ATP-dependent helicase/nuclease subunit A
MAGGEGEADEDAGLSAAEKGTALHKALELLDFEEAILHKDEREWFSGYLEKLTVSGLLSAAEADSVGVHTLARFAGSNLAARAAASKFLMKETPFNMKLPYGEAIGVRSHFARIGNQMTNSANEAADASGQENLIANDVLSEEIVVQGVIDCMFEEEDGIVIADYKTGRFDVSAYGAEADRIRDAYGAQLQLYRHAAGLIFGKPVKESLVYMAQPGATVDIP